MGINEFTFSAYPRPSLNPVHVLAILAVLSLSGEEPAVSTELLLAVFQTDEDGKSPQSLWPAAQISPPGSAVAREDCAPRSLQGALAVVVAVMVAAVVAGGIAAVAVPAAAASVVAAVDVFSPATAVVAIVRVVAVGAVVARAAEIAAAASVAGAAALAVAPAVVPRHSA